MAVRTTALIAILAGVGVGAAGASGASVVPRSVERAIAGSVPTPFAFVPARAPIGWRYDAWDMGRETPGLFPRGQGLNIWFSTPYPNELCVRCDNRMPKSAGFHVYADKRCSVRVATKRLHVGKATIAWNSGFGDALVWRCTRVRGVLVNISIYYVTGRVSESVAARQAPVVARMLASARRLRTR